ncbi:hypothetical protein PTW37_03225 [Arthrobacter agilis]|uniref:hypothetical protein n=1 Tax=Arthrobacter agilis TaxID=37921 RepID=UPI002365865F|nr:hypothetical protein [Arthrobacter agilis]WDF33950.1 hypothetical protein PTW37_03225 [Arthrobacter agilis]
MPGAPVYAGAAMVFNDPYRDSGHPSVLRPTPVPIEADRVRQAVLPAATGSVVPSDAQTDQPPRGRDPATVGW